MIVLRLGLVSLLCVACFKPQGKAAETDGVEGSSEVGGSSGSTTSAVVTTTGGAEPTTEGTPTTEAVVTVSGATTEGPGTTTTETTAETSATTETDSGSSGEESSGGVMPVCGNGIIETGEKCDDGNISGGDECPANCKDPCGDGVLDGGEECDDANVIKGDGCSDLCKRDAAYVFVTSKQFAGDLGGLAAADMNCEMAAKMAALPGIYRAWLSDDVTPAISRLKPIDRPYVRTDGVQVAASFAQIVGPQEQKLSVAIALTEFKQVLKPKQVCDGTDVVWTATNEAGMLLMSANCENWQNSESPIEAVGGSLQQTDLNWTRGCSLMCNQGARLYCFEVGA